MHAEKVSISLPESLVRFVEHYRVAHHCKTRSQAFEEARACELEQAYRDADQEADTAAWDAVTADGLADETW